MASKTEYSQLDAEAESISSISTYGSPGTTNSRTSGVWRCLIIPWTAHLVFFVMYTTIMLLSKPSALYSTAPHILETGACRRIRLADDRHPIFDDFPMERQELVFDEVDEGGSPYSGRPNARTERSWEEMLSGSCVPSRGGYLVLTA